MSNMPCLLNETIPHPGQLDLRGFEWHYLNRLCRNSGFCFLGHSDGVVAVALQPMRILVTASEDRTVRLWDTTTGEQTRVLTAEGLNPWRLALHPDGSRIAAASTRGLVVIWNARTGEVVHRIQADPESVYDLAFDHIGTQLATAGTKGRLDHVGHGLGQGSPR